MQKTTCTQCGELKLEALGRHVPNAESPPSLIFICGTCTASAEGNGLIHQAHATRNRLVEDTMRREKKLEESS
jgi:hypothetical protein